MLKTNSDAASWLEQVKILFCKQIPNNVCLLHAHVSAYQIEVPEDSIFLCLQSQKKRGGQQTWLASSPMLLIKILGKSSDFFLYSEIKNNKERERNS